MGEVDSHGIRRDITGADIMYGVDDQKLYRSVPGEVPSRLRRMGALRKHRSVIKRSGFSIHGKETKNV